MRHWEWTAECCLSQLDIIGISVSLGPDDTLILDAPVGLTFTDDMRGVVQKHKAGIVQILQGTSTVVAVDSAQTIEKPRIKAARLIRQARRARDRDLAIALRDAWRERIAICMIDGGQSLKAAEAIAIAELTNNLLIVK